jgi:hypothetical protein
MQVNKHNILKILLVICLHLFFYRTKTLDFGGKHGRTRLKQKAVEASTITVYYTSTLEDKFQVQYLFENDFINLF